MVRRPACVLFSVGEANETDVAVMKKLATAGCEIVVVQEAHFDTAWKAIAAARRRTLNEAVFTYDEVTHALCDACRLRIPDVWCDEKITHRVNGVEIPCDAIAWRRNREIHAKAHPPNVKAEP